MRPISESVSRGRQQLISISGANAEQPDPTVEPPSSAAKSEGGQ
jgi:hypothetical protein